MEAVCRYTSSDMICSGDWKLMAKIREAAIESSILQTYNKRNQRRRCIREKSIFLVFCVAHSFLDNIVGNISN